MSGEYTDPSSGADKRPTPRRHPSDTRRLPRGLRKPANGFEILAVAALFLVAFVTLGQSIGLAAVRVGGVTRVCAPDKLAVLTGFDSSRAELKARAERLLDHARLRPDDQKLRHISRAVCLAERVRAGAPNDAWVGFFVARAEVAAHNRLTPLALESFDQSLDLAPDLGGLSLARWAFAMQNWSGVPERLRVKLGRSTNAIHFWLTHAPDSEAGVARQRFCAEMIPEVLEMFRIQLTPMEEIAVDENATAFAPAPEEPTVEGRCLKLFATTTAFAIPG